jgi:4,5-dihydroxyphthalate decarboxylase
MRLRLVLLPGTTVSEPIIRGEVAVDGLDVDVITTIDGRQIRTFADLDAAKDLGDVHSAGSSTVIQYTAMGNVEPRRFIPVFHARGPKCRNLLVRDDSSVTAPQDLRGRRVGVSNYTNTASIWLRGMLQDEYEVAPPDIIWVEGERDFLASDTPSIRREQVGSEAGVDRNRLLGMLQRGEIDALCWTGGGGYYAFYPGGPIDRFCQQQGGIRSLIDDPAVILDYYQRTFMDHITETVAIRESTLEREPDAPRLLLELFSRAAEVIRSQMSAEERELQTKEAELLSRDPFDYRLGKAEINSITTLARYNREQEITPRAPSLEELVPASLLG